MKQENTDKEELHQILDNIMAECVKIPVKAGDAIEAKEAIKHIGDKYKLQLKTLIHSSNKRLEEKKYLETLDNLAGRGYITFEQRDYLKTHDWKPIQIEPSSKARLASLKDGSKDD